MDPEEDVSTAAAHILMLIDDVQERLQAIRETAQKLVAEKNGSDDAADT